MNPYKAVREILHRVVEETDLPEAVCRRLAVPMRFLEVNLTVKRDDGSVESFTAYRSQHLDVLGPFKGGIRFHPNVDPDEVRALSVWMTLKGALLDLPLGGAKGGVVVDPRQLSAREIESLARAYVRALAPVLGPETDIPAPDVNTNPRVIAWMADEYARVMGRWQPAAFTGKPLEIGGSPGREAATGRGVAICVREAGRRIGLDLRGARVAVQGFGNVGFHAARLLAREGCRVVAVSDSSGGVYNSQGLDPDALLRHKRATRSVSGFPGSEPLDGAGILTLDVDVLVPAALENSITEEVADRVKARVVAEAANGPTTPWAGRILHEQGTYVIPDVLCNAGGVTVSYFEWIQNRQGDRWTEDEVNRRLEERMVAAFDRVHRLAVEHRIEPRTAAYRIAVARLARAMQERGWL